MKVAIVYDRVNKWGGAERVLLTLHELFPEAPLYTSVYDPIGAPWAKVFPKVVTSFLQKFPFARSNHEFLAPLMPLAFESFDFSDFDLVISVTSEAAKGVRTKPGTLHICYCLTPTRYLWSHHDEYFRGQSSKAMAKPFIERLRKWDKIASQRPDKIIAISTEVKNRIKKYYGRESDIIFPPVDTNKSQTPNNKLQTNSKSQITKPEYYLIVSRLVKYKKVDLAVETFNRLGYPIVIVGTGREEGKLKRMAGKNIKFVGQVSDKKLTTHYRNAKALIMPQEEDFGIVAIEAQSFGVPVIAFKKGGAIDTVIDGKTGFFFESQTMKSLENVIKNFDDSMSKTVTDHRSIKPGDCVENANRFSKEKFKKELSALINMCGMQ
jgi:glycosyltransferase involved in cell wall biosynthesis